ncbi:MAG: hypothetical protein KDK91_00550 [Gammaproteobacteria bacterium]|nr:hypothetical protein [Gammaproteobacteria bacterium]
MNDDVQRRASQIPFEIDVDCRPGARNTTIQPAALTELAEHLLRCVGFETSESAHVGTLHWLLNPDAEDADAVQVAAESPAVFVAIQPAPGFLSRLGLPSQVYSGAAGTDLDSPEPEPSLNSVRTLHDYHGYAASAATRLLQDSQGNPVWYRARLQQSQILVLGTDPLADALRFRQGDPQRAGCVPAEQWGFSFERPVHLYTHQVEGLAHHQRPADDWTALLGRSLVELGAMTRVGLLPDDAPGAVIITGDDDQAYLEKYARQAQVLADLRLTWFMHPQTRHTRATLRDLRQWVDFDLGIHPDACDAPERYAELFRLQMHWFRKQFGREPSSVRNHGYLNQGYWGHHGPWEAEKVRFSSNVPGVDGRVLNGSLLPARLYLDGRLTEHWTVLTAIGDGIVGALGRTDADGARAVLDLADAIRARRLPGIVVANLHPQNVEETLQMHGAMRELVHSGFTPWTMADCLNWFVRRETHSARRRARFSTLRQFAVDLRRALGF